MPSTFGYDRHINTNPGSMVGSSPMASLNYTTTAGLANVWESDSSFIAEVELPGVTAKGVSVDISNGILTIRGERCVTAPEDARFCHQRQCFEGPFTTQTLLSSNLEALDCTNVNAQLQNGVLTVVIAKVAKSTASYSSVRVNSTSRKDKV